MANHIKHTHPELLTEVSNEGNEAEPEASCSSMQISMAEELEIEEIYENENCSTSTDNTIRKNRNKNTRNDSNSTASSAKVVQPTISKTFKKISAYSDGGDLHKKITEALIHFIVVDNRPFHLIQCPGFRHFMSTVSPLYRIPANSTLKKRVDESYEYYVAKIKKELTKIKCVSLTSDIWTETMCTKSFLGLTIHYVFESQLKSINLEVYELLENHTSDYIAKCLIEVLEKWEIPNSKVMAVITDNGRNILKAVTDTFGKNKHIPCMAHTLNLVAENSIKSTENLAVLLGKVRALVIWIKKSVVISDQLRNLQKKEGIPEGKVKKMVLDVPTRWNTVFYMIERFLEMSSYVNRIVIQHTSAPHMMTNVELSALKELLNILAPLETMTREASSEKYVSVSKVIPMINCAMKTYSSLTSKNEICIALCAKIIENLKYRFGQAEHVSILSSSCLLDPRFKNLHFSNPIACSNGMSNIRKQIENELLDSSESDIEIEIEQQDISSFDFWQHHKNLAHKSHRKSKSVDELTLFLSNPVSGLRQDPILNWKELKPIFPHLFEIAQKYWCIVATSVPSERLFSKTGATVTQARNRLLGARLNKLIFLNSILPTIIKK